MKEKLAYTLEGIGILGFCCLPDSLENLSLGAAVAVITVCSALLFAGAMIVNKYR